jgi:hypothetical protein
MTIRREIDDLEIVEHRSGGEGLVAELPIGNQELQVSSPLPVTIESGNSFDRAAADDDLDDDDVTVIVLEPGDDEDELMGSGWIDQDSPEIRARRRNVLLRELQRVQRASFIHFMVLCLIPTSLLFIVIATVVGDDDDCQSAATTCEKEPRTFVSTYDCIGCCLDSTKRT